uniref:Serine/threonine-protein phosphatase PGAM5, mitochondrial n=1 Tax=Elaeophora elaphi TaxID=1147741 RepID=A0A158Q7H9_9BILA
MPSLYRLSAVTLSALAGGVYYFRSEKWPFSSENDALKSICLLNTAECAEIGTSSSYPFVHTSPSLPCIHPFPQSKWDHNWDNREPKYMVNPVEYEEADPAGRQNMLNEATPTSKRNIILIRHGQYFTDRNDKNYLSLTPLANFLVNCSFCLNFATEGSRIEAAFRKYIHRAGRKQKDDSWELIVCHGNVIRYFVCRALQFPPEGWLRLSVGHCSITWIVIYPNGFVSVRSLGDIGHLPNGKVSF